MEDGADEEWIGILEASILAVILFAAVVGNGLVCAVVHRRRELRRTVTHFFILSLAVTDISVALLCMPFSVITAANQTWNFSKAFCLLNGFLNVFFLLASILTLTAISVYKYIRVVKPGFCAITRRTALIAVAFVWFLALFTALTPLMGWNSYEHIEGRNQCSIKVPENAAELTNCLFVIICGFVFPLSVMSFSYRKIFHTVRTHTKRVRLSRVVDKRRSNAFLSEKRTTMTLFIILAVFLVCWAPFSVLTIYTAVSGKESSRHFSVAGYWLGFLNSALNPVIYAFRTKEFRDGYLEIIGMVLPCCIGRRIRRTFSTTFKWSQERSGRSSTKANTKRNSVNTECPPEGRTRATTNTSTLKEEDIALRLGFDEGAPMCEVLKDQEEVNDQGKTSAFRLNEDTSLERPQMHLNKDESLTTSTVAPTTNGSFALDHNDGGKGDREFGRATRARKRSHSDSAIKYQKQQKKHQDSGSACSTCELRSYTNEGVEP